MKLRTFILMMIIWLVIPALAQDKKGSLNINTVPDNATVSIDDELAGTTPLTLSNITAGKHRLVIKKEGYTTIERIIEVPADEIKKVEILLTKIEKPKEETPPPTITPAPTSTTQDQDKKTPIEVGLRIGSYNPSNIETEPTGIYEKSGSLIGIDLTIGTHNPNLSWRISLDNMSLSGEATESYWTGYSYSTLTVKAELKMQGISAAIIGHTPRTEKTRLYGGFALGSYKATEDISISAGGDSASVSTSKSAIGTNFFGGVLLNLSPQASVGFEISILSVEFERDYGGTAKLGGTNFSLGFNVGF